MASSRKAYNNMTPRGACLYTLFWVLMTSGIIFGIDKTVKFALIIVALLLLIAGIEFIALKQKRVDKNIPINKFLKESSLYLQRGQVEFAPFEEVKNRNNELSERCRRLKLKEKSKVENAYFKNIERFDNLTPREFEIEIAYLFEKSGFKVKLTPQSNDGGKDAIMKKDEKKYLLECKRYSISNKVGRPEIQKFYGVIKSENALSGYFVTTGYFHKNAILFAENLEIELINRDKLFAMSLECCTSDKIENVSIMCSACEKTYSINPIEICKRELNEIKCECTFEIKISRSDYLPKHKVFYHKKDTSIKKPYRYYRRKYKY